MPSAISNGAVSATVVSRSIRKSEAIAKRESRKGVAFVVTLGAAMAGSALLLAGTGRGSEKPSSEALQGRGIAADGRTELTPVAADAARVTLKGRILDAEGHAAAGERVEAESDTSTASKWATHTQPDGSFRIEGIGVGKVRVRAGDDGSGTVESALLELSETHDVVLVLSPTREVSGVVLDERGVPVARARMRWFGRGASSPRFGSTDEQGRYSIHRAFDDADRLAVWADGFDVETIVLEAGSPAVQQLDVRLHHAVPLRGVVVGPAGEPVAGARISACQGDEMTLATTDQAGAFALPAVTMGCWVTAGHVRFASAIHRRITAGQPLTVRLGAGGAVEGTVVDSRHHPIGAFTVSIVSARWTNSVKGLRPRLGDTTSFLRGEFRIGDLAPGTYVLLVRAEGKVDAESAPIVVHQGKVRGGEQLVLADENNPLEATSGGVEPKAEGAESTQETTESAEPAPDPGPQAAPHADGADAEATAEAEGAQTEAEGEESNDRAAPEAAEGAPIEGSEIDTKP